MFGRARESRGKSSTPDNLKRKRSIFPGPPRRFTALPIIPTPLDLAISTDPEDVEAARLLDEACALAGSLEEEEDVFERVVERVESFWSASVRARLKGEWMDIQRSGRYQHTRAQHVIYLFFQQLADILDELVVKPDSKKPTFIIDVWMLLQLRLRESMALNKPNFPTATLRALCTPSTSNFVYVRVLQLIRVYTNYHHTKWLAVSREAVFQLDAIHRAQRRQALERDAEEDRVRSEANGGASESGDMGHMQDHGEGKGKVREDVRHEVLSVDTDGDSDVAHVLCGEGESAMGGAHEGLLEHAESENGGQVDGHVGQLNGSVRMERGFSVGFTATRSSVWREPSPSLSPSPSPCSSSLPSPSPILQISAFERESSPLSTSTSAPLPIPTRDIPSTSSSPSSSSPIPTSFRSVNTLNGTVDLPPYGTETRPLATKDRHVAQSPLSSHLEHDARLGERYGRLGDVHVVGREPHPPSSASEPNDQSFESDVISTATGTGICAKSDGSGSSNSGNTDPLPITPHATPREQGREAGREGEDGCGPADVALVGQVGSEGCGLNEASETTKGTAPASEGHGEDGAGQWGEEWAPRSARILDNVWSRTSGIDVPSSADLPAVEGDSARRPEVWAWNAPGTVEPIPIVGNNQTRLDTGFSHRPLIIHDITVSPSSIPIPCSGTDEIHQSSQPPASLHPAFVHLAVEAESSAGNADSRLAPAASITGVTEPVGTDTGSLVRSAVSSPGTVRLDADAARAEAGAVKRAKTG